MIHVLIEAFRLALAQSLLLYAASFALADQPMAPLAVMLAAVGLASGLMWSSGTFDGDDIPWGRLTAVSLLASLPGMLLWADQTQLHGEALTLTLILPAATLIGAALARLRWTPRVAIDEDPAAAWARHNRESYKAGTANGRIPDTLSFNPYAGLGNRELPEEDPWDAAPLDHQQDVGAQGPPWGHPRPGEPEA